jgi:hypothetical protein
VTFELQFQQLAEGAGAGEAADEFLLKIDARTVTTRLHDSAAGYSDPSTLELTRSELSELAWKLAEREPSRFRKNLWASSYADLTLRVLDQEVSLVARPYSGVDRGSHGGLQEDFDATVELLRSLHGRVLREGHGTALDS